MKRHIVMDLGASLLFIRVLRILHGLVSRLSSLLFLFLQSLSVPRLLFYLTFRPFVLYSLCPTGISHLVYTIFCFINPGYVKPPSHPKKDKNFLGKKRMPSLLMALTSHHSFPFPTCAPKTPTLLRPAQWL